MPLPRRQFLQSSAGLLASGAFLSLLSPSLLAQTPAATAPTKAPPPKPPALPPDKVQSVVGQAHRNLDAVRALVEETPLLANASWDWGGGDFETPLQAAAHTGGRAIAEYLLSQNARLDLYAAAMLGQLDFLKAAIAADPAKLAAIPGPHGFTVLHCAKQGGEKARPVYDFLLAQGVPEVFQRPLPYIWPAGTKPAA
jgi:hypothetical protein